MTYFVSKKTLNQYLNLELSDNDLFPSEAPVGTSFYDLEPENDKAATVTVSHITNLLKRYISGSINENRLKKYIESILSLDLFDVDDSDEYQHDLIINTLYTLDEIKDIRGITHDDAKRFLNLLSNRIIS